jgi:hypothetical protein
MGCSGRTAHRRLRTWEELGIWDRLHADLLCLLPHKGFVRAYKKRPLSHVGYIGAAWVPVIPDTSTSDAHHREASRNPGRQVTEADGAGESA